MTEINDDFPCRGLDPFDRGDKTAYDVELRAFLELVKAELRDARKKFPNPDALVAALAEEVGELSKATLEEDVDRLTKEAAQVAGLAARIALEGDASLDHVRSDRVPRPRGRKRINPSRAKKRGRGDDGEEQ